MARGAEEVAEKRRSCGRKKKGGVTRYPETKEYDPVTWGLKNSTAVVFHNVPPGQ
jgi:hypothetical protein